MTIEPPDAMTAAEKRIFRRVVERLVAVDIDPESRAELLSDYVLLEARIAALRAAEAAAQGKESMAASRALNVATAERRRLHAALAAWQEAADQA